MNGKILNQYVQRKKKGKNYYDTLCTYNWYVIIIIFDNQQLSIREEMEMEKMGKVLITYYTNIY